MILIFDYFETIALTKVMDFNLGLRPLWEKYYKDKCSFEESVALGEELYGKLQEYHKQGLEYVLAKDELPEYALCENTTENRENIVFVGDTYNTDVEGANSAGIDVIWINHKDERNIDNLSVHSIRNTGKIIMR